MLHIIDHPLVQHKLSIMRNKNTSTNKFRQAMNGQLEDIKIAEDGEVVVVNRGDKGAAVVNFALEANEVALATGLADGVYTDTVYGVEFKVVDGVLTGTAQPETTYILVK